MLQARGMACRQATCGGRPVQGLDDGLGDGDAMQRGIHLAIAGAGRRTGRRCCPTTPDRGQPGMTRERRLAFESGRSSGFADDLGRRSAPRSRKQQQVRGRLARPCADALFQCGDLPVSATMSASFAGRLGPPPRPRLRGQPAGQCLLVLGPIQCTRSRSGSSHRATQRHPVDLAAVTSSPTDITPVGRRLRLASELFVVGGDR